MQSSESCHGKALNKNLWIKFALFAFS